MDPLTHGLLGLAVSQLRKADRAPGAARTPTDRAVLLGCVLAAGLPDLDYAWPAADPVLFALRAHRGLSHSVLAAPVVALVAALVALVVFRGARRLPVYGYALAAVLGAHLLPDAWTGWGTRLFLPLSDARVTLDWMMVVDPLFTLPLAVAAVVGWRRPEALRRSLLVGMAVAAGYLSLRIAVREVLTARVARAYPAAESVHLFPSVMDPLTLRFVVITGGDPGEHLPGEVTVAGSLREYRGSPRLTPAELRRLALLSPTLAEVVGWARFPVVKEAMGEGGIRTVAVADLRYHLRGEPTLQFEVSLDRHGVVTRAALERGGTASRLLRRLISAPDG